MADTPNMGLTLPVVQTTLGPTWASEVNDAFEEIDAHDHTTGKGVRVPTAGLNINADVAFGAYAALDVGRMELTDLGTSLSSGTTSLFAYDGELYYRDANGTNVQITDNGQVDNAAAGSILGLASPASAEFSSLTSQFGWFYDSGKQAAMQMGDLQIFPFAPPTAYANFITLKAPTALASNPTYTLPTAAPANANILAMSSAGEMSLGPADGSAANPSVAFASDLDTGLYWVGANTLGIAAGGSASTNFTSAGVRTVAGSFTAPSYSFTGDTDTGLYNSAANVLDLVTAGNRSLVLTATTAQFSGVLLQPAGSAGAPSYSFAGDTDTGLYSDGTSLLFSASGSNRMTLSSSLAQFTVPVAPGAGAVGSPTYTFSSDTNTGMYSYGADQIGFAAGGLLSLYVSGGEIQTTSYRFLADTNTGLSNSSADEVTLTAGGSSILSANTTAIITGRTLRALDGAAGTPAYSFSSDTDSGFYYGGSGLWYYSSNGSNTVRLNTSGLAANRIEGINSSSNYLNFSSGATSLNDASSGQMIGIGVSGSIVLGNGVRDFGFNLPVASISGSAGALQGYIALFINGGAFKIPYYNI